MRLSTKVFSSIGVAMLAVVGWAVPAAYATNDGGDDEKTPQHVEVTICHATEAEGHWVKQTVDDDSILNDQHEPLGNGHAMHQSGRDIIPPFTTTSGFEFPGKNWDGEGQAIFNNGCKAPQEEPPVDMCKNIDGIQTEVPEGYTQHRGKCYPPKDVCKNIDGVQTEVPEGYWEKDGKCYPKVRDVCKNIDGVQSEVPEGYWEKDGKCYPIDVCKNIDGNQTEVPEGYWEKDGKCYPPKDVCKNLDGNQSSVPDGWVKEGDDCFYYTYVCWKIQNGFDTNQHGQPVVNENLFPQTYVMSGVSFEELAENCYVPACEEDVWLQIDKYKVDSWGDHKLLKEELIEDGYLEWNHGPEDSPIYKAHKFVHLTGPQCEPPPVDICVYEEGKAVKTEIPASQYNPDEHILWVDGDECTPVKGKVDICHATGSRSNPYTSNEVSWSSVNNKYDLVWNGHGEHKFDVIPPFDVTNPKGDVLYTYPGKNWNEFTQAYWENGCKPPTIDICVWNDHKGTAQQVTIKKSEYNPQFHILWDDGTECTKVRDDVDICHANRDDRDPYSTDAIRWWALGPWHGVDWDFHNFHRGDIIPPFEVTNAKGVVLYSYEGKNWTQENQEIWENDCEPPVVDVCDNLRGDQEEVPEGWVEEDGYCFYYTFVCWKITATDFDTNEGGYPVPNQKLFPQEFVMQSDDWISGEECYTPPCGENVWLQVDRYLIDSYQDEKLLEWLKKNGLGWDYGFVPAPTLATTVVDLPQIPRPGTGPQDRSIYAGHKFYNVQGPVCEEPPVDICVFDGEPIMVTIPAGQYNPEVHVLWVDGSECTPVSEPPVEVCEVDDNGEAILVEYVAGTEPEGSIPWVDGSECQPSLEGTVLGSVCVGDVPYLDYSVVVFDPLGSIDPTALPTLTFVNPVGDDHVIALPDFAGQILWPGASVDGDGNATGWPGWEYDSTAEEWVSVGDDNFGWTRNGVDVIVEVNPSTTVTADYPAATELCAGPPEEFTTVLSAPPAATPVVAEATYTG